MRNDDEVHPAAFVSEVALHAAGGGDGVGGQVAVSWVAVSICCSVAGFGGFSAVGWVLLGFCAFEGHGSSVSRGCIEGVRGMGAVVCVIR